MAVTSQTDENTLRVLLVEDDPVQRHVLKLLLEKQNHVLITASNGEEALAEANLLPLVLQFLICACHALTALS